MTTKTHSVAAMVAGAALVATTLAPAYDLAIMWFIAALPLAASLAAWRLQRGTWSKDLLVVLMLEVVVVMVVPRLYIYVRCQHDAGRVVELAEQSRVGEARALAHQVLALSPGTMWQGNSLKLAADNLDRAASEIERRVSRPLTDNASAVERLNRARDLAMLGQTDEALQVLDAAESSTDAANLRGTIYDSRGEWRVARDWYQQAKVAWQQRQKSPAQTAGLIRAVTGVAFCERKLGRLREAEAAWQERLELLPTAESHFLLAQFYDDVQQAEQARFHVQQAMRLEPERYALQGRRLLDKLVTSHFGCLGVFRAESSPSTPFGATTIESQ